MTKNHLIHETSPYLLQHADNPVHWYAWNDEALQKAKNENKPIFLSIGYSACHWCHVMAHESFENDDIAKFMNENFVNIKVDREERPDIDDIYQKVCQIATGQGGWPLSIFLTPDQKPFYVGTYFPILDSYGRSGFGSILRQLAQAWKEKPKDIETIKERLSELKASLMENNDANNIAVIKRRWKTDNLKGLPDKIEHVIPKPMPTLQAQAYSKIVEDYGQAEGDRGRMLKALHSLRNVSLHPLKRSNESDDEYIP